RMGMWFGRPATYDKLNLIDTEKRVLQIKKGNDTAHDHLYKEHGIAMAWENGVLVRAPYDMPKQESELDRAERDRVVREEVGYLVSKGKRVARDERDSLSLPAYARGPYCSPELRRMPPHKIVDSVDRQTAKGQIATVHSRGRALIRLPHQRYHH